MGRSIFRVLRILLFLSLTFLLVRWPWLLDKSLPSDYESRLDFEVMTFLVIVMWLVLGVLSFWLKNKKHTVFVHTGLFLVALVFIYLAFPWLPNGRPGEIVRHYKQQKNSHPEVRLDWQYTLPENLENYPLIDLSEQKLLSEIKPEKIYFFRCFYYDSSQVQQYVDQFIIYYKGGVPHATVEGPGFVRTPEGQYLLTRRINDTVSVVLRSDGDSLNFQPKDPNPNEDYYRSIGTYTCTIKREDLGPYGVLREKYWIYKLFTE